MDPLGTVNAASGMASTASTVGNVDVLSIRGLSRLVPLLHLGTSCTRHLRLLSRADRIDSPFFMSSLYRNLFISDLGSVCRLPDLTVDGTSLDSKII
jgi:hypothetical protein